MTNQKSKTSKYVGILSEKVLSSMKKKTLYTKKLMELLYAHFPESKNEPMDIRLTMIFKHLCF